MTAKNDRTVSSGVFHFGNASGRATGGVILSVVLAAAIIAFVVYYITGSRTSPTSGGGGMNPFGLVEETKEDARAMQQGRDQLGQLTTMRTERRPGRLEDPAFYGALDNQIARAKRDCGDIAEAIEYFRRDVNQWPVSSASNEDVRVDFLFGNVGRLPEFGTNVKDSWGARSDNLHSYLVSNGPEKKAWYDYLKNVFGRFDGWNGPYLPHEYQDPWGHAYLVSVSGFPEGTNPDNRVWCLCAGPNGIVETPASSSQTLGDDVGKLVE